jgi:hypothetical protein
VSTLRTNRRFIMAHLRRLALHSLAAVGLLGTLAIGTGASSAGVFAATPAAASGNWFFAVVSPNPTTTSYYVAAITQTVGGTLSGFVRETDRSCWGSLSGSTSGTTVKMRWSFSPVTCSGDVLFLSGTLGNTGTTMGGVAVVVGQGQGSFTGKHL